MRERIFEPFYTTKGPGEGAGVGLSVVHGIVKGHRGKIVVRSEPGKGSTFELYFPMIEGMEERPEIQLPPSPAGEERILLVDDEELVVAVASEMLIGIGYEVVSVQRSSEALDLFRLQPQRFHLIYHRSDHAGHDRDGTGGRGAADQAGYPDHPLYRLYR